MTDYFSDFKPIRNRIMAMNLFDILADLVRLRKDKKPKSPEVIEFLYVNAIIYGTLLPSNREYNKNMCKVFNDSNSLLEKIDASLLDVDKNPFNWLYKYYINQSKAHTHNVIYQMFRYYTIFSETILKKHIERVLGISYYEFFLGALWIYSVFAIRSYCIKKSYFFSPNLSDSLFNNINISKILDILSIKLEDLKIQLKNNMVYDENVFIFHKSQHIVQPLFEYNNNYYCLYPEYLLKQITSGIYYLAEIYKPEYKLSGVFGKSFEKYIGQILLKNNMGNKYIISEEIIYKRKKGQENDKTSDWIIISDEDIIFIECKTKRTLREFKFYTSSATYEEAIIHETSLALKQIYKVYDDYRNDLIEALPFDDSKNFVPILVYLENDQLNFFNMDGKITNELTNILNTTNIDSSLILKYPFHIYGSDEFELDVQIMFKNGFYHYFDMMRKGEIDVDFRTKFQYMNYYDDDFNREFIERNIKNKDFKD